MKISRKQQNEIDFLYKEFPRHFEHEPSQEEKEEYVLATVHGKGKVSIGGIGQGRTQNPIFDAKRTLDITIKMWRESLYTDKNPSGVFFIQELYDEFGGTEFGKKLIDSVAKLLNG